MFECTFEVIEAGACSAIYRPVADAVATAALDVFGWVQPVFQKGKTRDDLKN